MGQKSSLVMNSFGLLARFFFLVPSSALADDDVVLFVEFLARQHHRDHFVLELVGQLLDFGIAAAARAAPGRRAPPPPSAATARPPPPAGAGVAFFIMACQASLNLYLSVGFAMYLIHRSSSS